MNKDEFELPPQEIARACNPKSDGAPKGLEHYIQLAQKKIETNNRLAKEHLTTRQLSISLDELETFPEFHRKRPNISQNQLEWIYRHRQHNGFAKAFKKIGKLRYVIVPVFTALLLSNEGDA